MKKTSSQAANSLKEKAVTVSNSNNRQKIGGFAKTTIASLFFLLLSFGTCFASHGGLQDYTSTSLGITVLVIFVLAYALIVSEEFIHFRKFKPAIFGGILSWIVVSIVVHHYEGGNYDAMNELLNHNMVEYAELMLFLMVAMTYINTMIERNVFESLRSWLVMKRFTYRNLFWITGIMAFFISPIADNLTTALLMGTVIITVAKDDIKFINLCFINIVVAANAGGAFSPFGDITTLMVWQAEKAHFFDFFRLFIPAVVTYIIPAIVMSFAVSKEVPSDASNEMVRMKKGAKTVCFLFLITITSTVILKQFFHLPPFMGMMLGLGYLFLYAFYLKKIFSGEENSKPFDVFQSIAHVEWDTLFFFFGIIFCVGALNYIGYLKLVSMFSYEKFGATISNTGVGFLSAIVDNIPVMFAVLNMNIDMNLSQWLLVTLTAGVGGSLLSVGSAAGVALMGYSKGRYTFFSHLKWTPFILLGYFASVWVHLLINH